MLFRCFGIIDGYVFDNVDDVCRLFGKSGPCTSPFRMHSRSFDDARYLLTKFIDCVGLFASFQGVDPFIDRSQD